MRKVLSSMLVITIVIASLFILTGCEKEVEEENGISSKNGVNLVLDLSKYNEKIYDIHLDLSKKQKIRDFREDEPDHAKIWSKDGNYIIDLMMDQQPSGAMEQFSEAAKKQKDYEECKFGEYDGYYYTAGSDGVIAAIILDSSDENSIKYIHINAYIDDTLNEKKNDILSIFKSKDVQKFLSSITIKERELEVNE